MPSLPRLRPSVAGMAMAVAALLGLGTTSASAAVAVDDVPISSWRVNGTVYAIEMVGDMLLVGGKFTAAIAPTGRQTARSNLAAFSLSTGALLTDWKADADGQVRALASDGDSLWVGGQFTSLDGGPQTNIGKLAVSDGSRVASFAPRLPGRTARGVVRAILADGPAVYVGGTFGRANGDPSRARLVKLDGVSGATVTAFAAQVDKPVLSLARSSAANRLFVGGQFDMVGGVARAGLAGLDATTGELVVPPFGGPPDPDLLSLDLDSTGTTLYGATTSNLCVSWDAETGRRNWGLSVDGNVQAVRHHDGTVYCGFHDGYQGDTLVKVLAVDATRGVVDPSWRPRINSFWGVHALDVTDDEVVLGGAFTSVSDTPARGLAIFRSAT